jgi:hypothetical protein
MTATIKTTRADEAFAETRDSHWNWLYKIGGAVALIILVLIPIGAIPFIISPRPTTVAGWFTLLQNNPLLGIALLDLPNLIVNIVGILLYLALYPALRRASESFMAIATTLGIVASALYITANPAFAMLSLNDQYAAAATDAQRATVLAAGQTILVIYQSSTAFNVSYAFGAIATLILSIVMLRSNLFSKVTAYAGILASIITIGLFVPGIGLYISVFSLLPYALWLILTARTLFRLGRFAEKLLS